MAEKPVININDAALAERGHAERFRVKWGRIGPQLGLSRIGCAMHVVPPGKRAFPYHAHHEADELFYILSGEGEYRYGEDIYHVRAGDLLGAPAGKTAHQIINTGTEELKYLGMSSMGSFDVVEYPDSGKFGVAAGIRNGDFKTASFVQMSRAGTPLGYWDGEDSEESPKET
jgi:uncharacterized cupin superfamily protein